MTGQGNWQPCSQENADGIRLIHMDDTLSVSGFGKEGAPDLRKTGRTRRSAGMVPVAESLPHPENGGRGSAAAAFFLSDGAVGFPYPMAGNLSLLPDRLPVPFTPVRSGHQQSSGRACALDRFFPKGLR